MTLDCKSLPESNRDADTALVRLSAPSECLPGSRRMLGHGVVASVFLKCCTGLVVREPRNGWACRFIGSDEQACIQLEL